MIDAVRHRLGEAIFERVAGPDGPEHRARIHDREGPRWFEPGSPITVVHGDASMFVGGIRAVLLQTLHPAAMRAVAEHSGYRGDTWGRLARTSRFLAVTTFGHAEDAQQMVDVDPLGAPPRHRHDARRLDLRRLRPAPAGVGPRRRGRQLPARLHRLRRHHADPGRARHLRGPGGRGRPRARRRRPAAAPEAELAERVAAFRPELRGTPEARDAVRYLLLQARRCRCRRGRRTRC